MTVEGGERGWSGGQGLKFKSQCLGWNLRRLSHVLLSVGVYEGAHYEMDRERKRSLLQKIVYPFMTVEERHVMSMLVGVSVPVPKFKAAVPRVVRVSTVYTTPSWKQ